jgi:hypothetical protein
MSDLVVKRWSRYGNDRLYVSTAGGERVGWRDLKTGATVVQAPEHAIELEAVLAAWSVVIPGQAPAVVEAEELALPPGPAQWHDLAAVRPGELARAQAERNSPRCANVLVSAPSSRAHSTGRRTSEPGGSGPVEKRP